MLSSRLMSKMRETDRHTDVHCICVPVISVLLPPFSRHHLLDLLEALLSSDVHRLQLLHLILFLEHCPFHELSEALPVRDPSTLLSPGLRLQLLQASPLTPFSVIGHELTDRRALLIMKALLGRLSHQATIPLLSVIMKVDTIVQVVQLPLLLLRMRNFTPEKFVNSVEVGDDR